MSILVTGGAGFIGSFVTRTLLRRGEKVVVLDLSTSYGPLKQILEPDEMKRVAVARADVADSLAFFHAVREHEVHRIIHLAAIGGPKAELNPWNTVRIDVQGTLNCFEAARMFGIDRVVWSSSATVFGRHTPYSKEFGGPLRDEGPQRPAMAYSACKSLCEYMGSHYHRKFGLDLRGLRPCGTFGPGRRVGGTADISELVRAAALGQPYTMTNGEKAIPHAYVEDTARAFVSGLYYEGKEMAGRSLSIGGHSTTHRQMAEIVRRVVPEAEITVQEGDDGEPVTLPIDNSNLRRLTGFQLEYSLEDGVRATVEYYRKHRDKG